MKIKIWRLESRECILTLGGGETGHTDWVTRAVFDNDEGLLIASCSYDRKAKVWRVADGECLLTFFGHKAWVSSVCFAPRKLATNHHLKMLTASGDCTLKDWELTLDAKHAGQADRTFYGHKSWVLSCGYSSDGKRICSSSADGTVIVWDDDSGALLYRLQMRDWVEDVAFKPSKEQAALIAAGGNAAFSAPRSMADAAPAGGATPRGGAGLFGGESRDYSLACSGHQVDIALFDLQGPGAENRPSLVLRRKPSLLLLVLKWVGASLGIGRAHAGAPLTEVERAELNHLLATLDGGDGEMRVTDVLQHMAASPVLSALLERPDHESVGEWLATHGPKLVRHVLAARAISVGENAAEPMISPKDLVAMFEDVSSSEDEDTDRDSELRMSEIAKRLRRGTAESGASKSEAPSTLASGSSRERESFFSRMRGSISTDARSASISQLQSGAVSSAEASTISRGHSLER